jgi:hypothetical protein
MKVCVGTRSRASGKEPSRLCLGRCSLPVAAVLDCHDECGARLFSVRVLDGRRFTLRLHTDNDEWDLVAAYGPVARRHAPNRQPMLPLLALLAVALSRKALQLAKRTGRAAPAPAGVLPGGGAPA